MPEQYNKIAEGIVKGNVPMVASFVERYVSDDEPGFFVGDRERVEGDVRVHVTVFGHLEQSDSLQLGVVDLQQLPEGRVWMVVGVMPTLMDMEAWLNDVYTAMVRRMAARLVQFGFLDAPNRPRLKSASLTLAQVAQALTPPKPTPVPGPALQPVRPAASPPPAAPATPPAEPPRPASQPVTPLASEPAAQAAPVMPTTSSPPPAPPVASRAVPSPATLTASLAPSSPAPSFLSQVPGQRLDLVLTIVMLFIWALACGVLFYLLTLLLK
jgi:hypothetical protein